MARAAEIQSKIRVVKQQPTAVLASLLDTQFSSQVRTSTVQNTAVRVLLGMQYVLLASVGAFLHDRNGSLLAVDQHEEHAVMIDSSSTIDQISSHRIQVLHSPAFQ